MNITSEKRVAVLGLGIIGSRACARLLEKGWKVSCWNRTPKGLTGEADCAQAVVDGADLISLYLKDSPAVRDVVAQIAPSLKEGQILLNHATLDLETTLWLEQICIERGCRFLNTPFTGSKLASADGQLFYYIGGDPDLAKSLEGFLSVTSRGSLYCGEIGAATVLKLATNLISACTVQAMAESLAIATHHGVTAECLIEAVSQNACASGLTATKFPSIAAGNYDAHFSLSNMGKDTRYMLALSKSAGLETPAIAAVSKRMGELCEKGLGDYDYSVLAKPYLEKL